MKFIHFRIGSPPKERGGVTFAYSVENGVAVYAIARCSPRDNYNKKIGRAIAVEHYDKAIALGEVRSVTVHGQPKEWPEQIINHYADSL